MLRLARPALAGAFALLWAGAASATPVIFTFVSSANYEATFPSTTTFTPALPFSGGGDVDEALGTYTLNLPDFTTGLNITVTPDATLTTTGWSQTGTFAGGLGGAMTSSGATGSTTCAVNGGIGAFVCGSFPAAVAPWPPTGASSPLGVAPGATINLANGGGYDGTITVNSAWDSNGGYNQSIYTYSFVPEPGTMLLLGMGLIGLAASGRRRA